VTIPDLSVQNQPGAPSVAPTRPYYSLSRIFFFLSLPTFFSLKEFSEDGIRSWFPMIPYGLVEILRERSPISGFRIVEVSFFYRE